jgi:hypothetical protein
MESQHGYGPNGLVLSQQEYTEGQTEALAESYEKLELVLRVLKGRDFRVWMAL